MSCGHPIKVCMSTLGGGRRGATLGGHAWRPRWVGGHAWRPRLAGHAWRPRWVGGEGVGWGRSKRDLETVPLAYIFMRLKMRLPACSFQYGPLFRDTTENWLCTFPERECGNNTFCITVLSLFTQQIITKKGKIMYEYV